MSCCCARRTATARELDEARAEAARHSSVHEFTLRSAKGAPLPLAEVLGGKVGLIVNTATACGLTPQLSGLQMLQERHAAAGFSVVAVPSNQFFSQNVESDEKTEEVMCARFKTTFPTAARVDVNGAKSTPLYRWLKAVAPAASRPGGGEEPNKGVLGGILAPISTWLSGTELSEVGRIGESTGDRPHHPLG